MCRIINKYADFVHNFKHSCLCAGSNLRTFEYTQPRHTANMYIPQFRLKFALTSPEEAIVFFLRPTNCLEYLWPLQ